MQMTKPMLMTMTTILLSGLCLTNSTWDLNKTVYNTTNDTLDLSPLIQELEDMCQIITLLNQENIYQQELLANISYNLENDTNTRISVLEQNQTNNTQAIISLLEDYIDPINNTLTTHKNDITDRVSEIENLYVTTGDLKTHNDTMNRHISDSIPEKTDLLYVYIALVMVMIVLIVLLISQRGGNVGKDPMQHMS